MKNLVKAYDLISEEIIEMEKNPSENNSKILELYQIKERITKISGYDGWTDFNN